MRTCVNRIGRPSSRTPARPIAREDPQSPSTVPHAATILLVDDEPQHLDTLEMLLRPLGHHLLRATTGRDALSQAAVTPPDLVLLDVLMPGLDGYAVCRQMRADTRLADVPILMLTGLDDRDARLKAFDAGADDFVCKPYDRHELRARVATIVRLNRSQRLHTARSRLQALIDRAPHGILITSGDGEIRLANPTALRLIGRPQREGATASIDRYLELSSGHPAAFLSRALAHPDETITLEGRVVRDDGSSLPVEIAAGAVPWETDQAVQLVLRDITERKVATQRIERQLRHLSTLRDVDMAVSATVDRAGMFGLVVRELRRQEFADAVAIFLVDDRGALELSASAGFEQPPPPPPTMGPAHDLPVLIELLTPERRAERARELDGGRFAQVDAVPLLAGARTTGLLEVARRTPDADASDWVDFLSAVGSSVALAIEKTRLIDHLRRTNDELTQAYDRTLEGWVLALDLRDKETEGHTQRVTELTVKLASVMGFSGDELEHIRRGALLHDIGKIGIPDRILLKAGPLDPDERALMEKHPVYAYQMLAPISYLARALDIPYGHHERWDGTGYPRGLRGTDIPLPARLFAVVDVWDALTSDRPYRKAWTAERTLTHIREQAGSHFDPAVVETFCRLIGGEHAAA